MGVGTESWTEKGPNRRRAPKGGPGRIRVRPAPRRLRALPGRIAQDDRPPRAASWAANRLGSAREAV